MPLWQWLILPAAALSTLAADSVTTQADRLKGPPGQKLYRVLDGQVDAKTYN